eukprot:1028888-Pelagomonas_calceolata.AAC.1
MKIMPGGNSGCPFLDGMAIWMLMTGQAQVYKRFTGKVIINHVCHTNYDDVQGHPVFPSEY